MALHVNNLEGNEIAADDYVRKASERGRLGDTWDVFKSNFGKIFLINVLILITFLPGVAIMIIRSLRVASLGILSPFNANTGIGYPANPGTLGLAETVYLSADVLYFPLLIVAGFIASVGLAGGAYSIKKLLATKSQFSFKSFFRGVKVCYFNALLPVTIFLLFYISAHLIGDWKALQIAQGASKAGPVTAYVFAIIATVIVGIYCGWLFIVGVSYKVTFVQLFKNAFVLMIGSLIRTVIFAGITLIPVWIFLIGGSVQFMRIISYIVFACLGFSFILLVWTSYTQWILDAYVTPNLKAEPSASKGVTQYAQESVDDEKTVAMELLAAGKSELICKPILPIDEKENVKPLGGTFTRGDMNKISEDRAKIQSDISAYEKEHMSDPAYAEYNKLFSDREKALKSDGKKGKKKKVSANNLLGK